MPPESMTPLSVGTRYLSAEPFSITWHVTIVVGQKLVKRGLMKHALTNMLATLSPRGPHLPRMQ